MIRLGCSVEEMTASLTDTANMCERLTKRLPVLRHNLLLALVVKTRKSRS